MVHDYATRAEHVLSTHAGEPFLSPVYLSDFLAIEGVGSHHDRPVCDSIIFSSRKTGTKSNGKMLLISKEQGAAHFSVAIYLWLPTYPLPRAVVSAYLAGQVNNGAVGYFQFQLANHALARSLMVALLFPPISTVIKVNLSCQDNYCIAPLL